MLESLAASGRTEDDADQKPADGCRACGGPVTLVRVDEQSKFDVALYRCQGECRGGGHRVTLDDELVNVGGPVFEGAPRSAVAGVSPRA